MRPYESSNFLVPNLTFWLELLVLVLVVVGLVWLVVRAVRPHSTADEVAKLARLRDTGALSESEFETRKARLLR